MSAAHALLVAVLLATAPQPAAELEVQAKQIETALIAPCCFRQQVSVHSSPAADEIRRDIRARLVAGEPPPQILEGYVARYGKQILAEPPAEGVGLALQVVPYVTVLFGFTLLLIIVRSLTARPHTGAISSAGPPLSPGEQRQLDEALRDLD